MRGRSDILMVHDSLMPSIRYHKFLQVELTWPSRCGKFNGGGSRLSVYIGLLEQTCLYPAKDHK